jgi:hypothetical protein
VHDRDIEPLVAVMVAMSPEDPPGSLTAGVTSLVMLSVFDTPVSDEASRSGAAVVAEIVILSDALGVDVFPAVSVSVAETAHSPSVSVGKVHESCTPMT